MIEERPFPWRTTLEVLFRRKWYLIAAVVLGIVGAALWIWSRPPLYRASAKILLTAHPVSGPREEAMSQTQIRSELALLSSPSLIRDVLEERGIESAEQGGESLLSSIRDPVHAVYRRLYDIDAPTSTDRRVEHIARSIDAAPVESSNLVEVAYTSDNPVWAATFVNSLLREHVERIARLSEESTAGGFFERQQNTVSQRLAEARRALHQFEQRQDVEFLVGDGDAVRRRLATLSEARDEARTELAEVRARVDYLELAISDHSETIASETKVVENESIQYLESRILELEIERSELLSRYAPTSLAVRKIDRQIEEAKKLLSEKAGATMAETTTAINPAYQTLQVDLVEKRAQLASLEARLAALNSQLRDTRDRLDSQVETSAESERLRSEVELAEEASQNFLNREEKARVARAFSESGIVNISIVEQAEVPRQPLPVPVNRILATGAIGGLLVGMIVAFVRDRLDPTVKGVAEAERLADLPVIGSVPRRSERSA